MQPAEMRDGGAVLGTVLGEIAEIARDVHHALASRLFGLLGPVALPARLIHDAIAATAYGEQPPRRASTAAVAGAVAAAQPGHRPPSPSRHAARPLRDQRAQRVLGDRIADAATALAPVMGLRTHDGRLRRVPVNVVHDVEAPTGRIVVFAHGLCENDRFWWYGAERNCGDRDVTYGSLLRDEQGWTPLYLHYNTGLHISENGRLLAGLPRIAGRQMAGAGHRDRPGRALDGRPDRPLRRAPGRRHDLVWVKPLRHIVGLGTPHLGAPLERAVNAGTHPLARLPETRPFADYLNRRSVGHQGPALRRR